MFSKLPLWSNTNEINAFLLFELGKKPSFKVPINIRSTPRENIAELNPGADTCLLKDVLRDGKPCNDMLAVMDIAVIGN